MSESLPVSRHGPVIKATRCDCGADVYIVKRPDGSQAPVEVHDPNVAHRPNCPAVHEWLEDQKRLRRTDGYGDWLEGSVQKVLEGGDVVVTFTKSPNLTFGQRLRMRRKE